MKCKNCGHEVDYNLHFNGQNIPDVRHVFDYYKGTFYTDLKCHECGCINPELNQKDKIWEEKIGRSFKK